MGLGDASTSVFDVLRTALKASYIIVEVDGGGDTGNNEIINFISNLATIDDYLIEVEGKRQSKGGESSLFWVVYVLKSWQGSFDSDFDSDAEPSNLGGSVNPQNPVCNSSFLHNSALSQGSEISCIFLEIHNENPTQNIQTILAHEVGHQFGLHHGLNQINGPCFEDEYCIPDAFVPEFDLLGGMGLMSDGYCFPATISFTNRHINLIRCRDKSPGQ
jgi:hypothetical protein